MKATELTPGSELETKYDETLTVTDVDGDEITWDVDGEYTESFSSDEVQQSIDDGMIEVVDTEDVRSDDEDDDFELEEISDIDPSELSDDDLYLRFGNLPEGGQSYDQRNDRVEEGVSVYDCERDTPEETDHEEAYYLKGTMLQTVFGLMTRHTYLVTGEQVGTGADGEPLLEDVEVVAKARTPEGVGGWVVEEQ